MRQALAAEEGALVKALSSDLASIEYAHGGVQLRTFEDVLRFSRWAQLSRFAPTGMTSAAQIAMAIEMGMEAGLGPLRALNSIDVIEGRPGWKVRAALGLVRASGLLGGFRRGWEGSPFEDDFEAFAWARRKDTGEELESRFSVADAKLARLWTRKGPWETYPRRMLYHRALGFLLHDLFEDVIGGWPIDADLADRVRTAEGLGAERRVERNVTPPGGPGRSATLEALAAGGTPASMDLPREREREPVPVRQAEPEALELEVVPTEESPPEPEPFTETAEPFTGPLPMSIGAEIARRVSPLLEQHQERVAAELEGRARDLLGAGATPAEVCEEVRRCKTH